MCAKLRTPRNAAGKARLIPLAACIAPHVCYNVASHSCDDQLLPVPTQQGTCGCVHEGRSALAGSHLRTQPVQCSGMSLTSTPARAVICTHATLLDPGGHRDNGAAMTGNAR